MTHKLHEGYSAKNPVPKVTLQSIFDPSGATEAKAKHLFSESDQDEKDQQNEAHDVVKQLSKGKEMDARDPVTGEETTIRHGDDENEHANINILSMDCPPPDWVAHVSYMLKLTRSAIVKIMAAYIIFPFLVYFVSGFLGDARAKSCSHSFLSLGVFLVLSLALPSFLAYSLLFALEKKSAEDFTDRVWDSERARGLAAGEDQDGNGIVDVEERTKESAEWVNAILRGIWPIINTDMFNSAVDMLEDIMQASVPKFVHSVRVADLGQGSNALRLTSIRSLPDADVDDTLHNANDAVKEHLMRDHVNVEVSFAYRALPSGSEASSKAHNAHLLIDFFFGMKGVYNLKLPVWVEVKGVSGTARARLELIPDPPFVKTTLITLMGLPRVSIGVVPMSKTLPNVMHIPILSSFISKSIDTACAEYVAPRSLTLDLQQLLSGDDIKKDTISIGVIIIHIHRATGLKKMDTRKLSDPYVTVTYSRQGKPLYSTRIIFADLNPCFEEIAEITIDANAIKVREKIILQLWDSDRASADDMMGYVEVDILDLMRNTNNPTRRISPLTGTDAESTLDYTVGYYAKMAPNDRLTTDGSDPAIPEDLKHHDPDFQEARAVALDALEAAVLVTPPDPDWPSGILSVQIHEIRDLKLRMEGRETSLLGRGKKEGQKGQDYDGEEQEEGSDLPSSYCTIVINDNLIYSTRVKPITSTPIFNAGTERFIRDWRSAHISIAVRDSRMRENDPILGLIFLKLSDLLVNASEVTRFFPLENGLGYGSARVSVLFRPVQASLPPSLLGFDAGTLSIRKISVFPGTEDAERLLPALQSCAVKIKASSSSGKVLRKNAGRAEDGAVVWHEEDGPSEISIQQRYSTAILITFREAGNLGFKKLAIAVLWMRDVVDNKDGTVEAALFKSDGGDYSRLKQNYVPPNGRLDMWNSDAEGITKIGTVRVELVLRPGIAVSHGRVLDKSDPGQKRLWDEVNRRDDSGLQKEVGNKSVPLVSGVENTEVGKEDAQVETRHGDGHADHPEEGSDEEEVFGEGSGGSGSDSEGGKGLLDKLRDWKHHENQLHQRHRGVMKMKPARTAEWLKDNAKQAGYKVKNRVTKLQTRQPDIETEV
ncbi:hypothetical protein M0805_003268 [Coniferiporia weirii]|nr:hypothetical protein M0805_003268 [Coniferiporia weirii]